MAYAYVVKGSEDGNIGVYSTMKKAKIAAAQYIAQSQNFHSEICIESETKYHVLLRGDYTSAEVEQFYIA